MQADGAFFVRGSPARSVTWREVAMSSLRPLELPEDVQPGSPAGTALNPVANFSFLSGAYGCVVGVDRATGGVEVERFVCIDDCGTVINPLLAQGQVQGGVAQGIAQALLEQVAHVTDHPAGGSGATPVTIETGHP